MTKSMLRTAGLICASAALVLSTTTPAQAASGEYVALGDSYSAGTGTRAKVDDCYRSNYGYPALIAAKYGLTLKYQACTGATTSGVLNNQVSALSSRTKYVTMTIGGNDVGFTSILTECAKPGWLSDCNAAIAGGRAILVNQLPGRYDNLFGRIKSRATSARVTVGGYPHIFNGEDCNALTFFSPQEETSLNSATSQLGTLIRSKASAFGFRYVDAIPSFKSHAVCDDVEWINGLSNPIEESYHPNRAGNQGYAAIFGPSVTGEAYRLAKPSAQSQSIDRVAPSQQVRAAAGRVLGMQIAAPANLAKAQAAGLDPTQIRQLEAQLRSPDTAVVRAALIQLKALDRQAS